jgi:threonine/homoserine/homoserine lactone efflux protein
MLEYLIIGMSYALSAATQPGPLQAFFLAKIAENGWKRTLPAAFAPLISDGPIALVAILLLQSLPVSFRDYLQFSGGLLLLYLAWRSLQGLRKESDPEGESQSSQPKTILQAALVNLLNPNPYLGWSLVMGPAVLDAWGKQPGYAITLLLAFYITMISASMIVIYLMGRALLLGPNARSGLTLVSALLLAGLGLYFLYQAGGRLADRFFLTQSGFLLCSNWPIT